MKIVNTFNTTIEAERKERQAAIHRRCILLLQANREVKR